ncbi:hypothetical protein CRG98_006850 [Punica granatum]|uniref:Uncharacterized protein n=1 Tax=Punica granatum TaxID=22663 RepID=A0A2I0KWC0_PUNGR|nr:hypothetical protein CRG98_006850 [Punica granatum]
MGAARGGIKGAEEAGSRRNQEPAIPTLGSDMFEKIAVLIEKNKVAKSSSPPFRVGLTAASDTVEGFTIASHSNDGGQGRTSSSF